MKRVPYGYTPATAKVPCVMDCGRLTDPGDDRCAECERAWRASQAPAALTEADGAAYWIARAERIRAEGAAGRAAAAEANRARIDARLAVIRAREYGRRLRRGSK
jgi:hypothetical protein